MLCKMYVAASSSRLKKQKRNSVRASISDTAVQKRASASTQNVRRLQECGGCARFMATGGGSTTAGLASAARTWSLE